MGKRGETTSYTTPTFEEVYTKKLEDLKVQLKGVLYGDTPFVVGEEYACKKCQGRINLHTQEGKWYCLRCALQPGAQAPQWSKETRTKVEAIMKGYPDLQKCREEWEPPKKEVPQRFFPADLVAFGARVEEARIAKGWSQEDLAGQILKRDGRNLSRSMINIIEKGHQSCSQHVRAQIDHILSCGICRPGVRCEKLEQIVGLKEATCLEA